MMNPKKTLITIILVPLIVFVIFLIYSTIFRYNPKDIETIKNQPPDTIIISDTLSIMDWNIGYCGLGSDMDFFYDGGTRMRTTYQRTLKNLTGILNEVRNADSCQFFNFQEVDVKSKRSYETNQLESFQKILPNYHSFLGVNYKVDYIPVPIKNPMGKAYGGLVSLCKFAPAQVMRYSIGPDAAWPKGLFMLQRCFITMRFPTNNGKEFVLINTHNSAYDNGSQRKSQMEFFKKFVENEYAHGNYVLAGGDWNQNPPVKGLKTQQNKEGHLTRIRIDSEYLPGDWTWLSDSTTPSNRMIDEPYNPETTKTTVIDFYLLSPNLHAINVKTHDLQFRFSDHQPVVLTFTFKPN